MVCQVEELTLLKLFLWIDHLFFFLFLWLLVILRFALIFITSIVV
jgi:hypothetical protein